MLPSAHLLSLRRHTAWLLALGLLAMALHALAGTGLAQARATAGKGDKFVAELCTSHGVFKADPTQTSSGGSLPAPAAHDCCKLCAAGAPLLAADMEVRVPPAPTFATPPDSYHAARPTLAVRAAHPARGPPARA